MKDFTSNDTQITGESEPNSTVEITFPDGQKVTTTADDQGHYIVDIPAGSLNNGGEVSAKATDKAGNESPKTIRNIVDEIAPMAPTMKDFTSNDTQITGESEPNSTVEVTFLDGQKVTVIADEQGDYIVDIPSGSLNNGGEVSAKATDKTGNESPKTTKDVADETVPEAPKVDNVPSNDIQIIGKTEPHASVTIQFPNKQLLLEKQMNKVIFL